jgi:hypothetical protein
MAGIFLSAVLVLRAILVGVSSFILERSTNLGHADITKEKHMIEFTVQQEVHTIFFVGTPEADALFVIHKPKKDLPWRLDYRFRYSRSEGDERNWYAIQAKPETSDEEATEKMYELVKKLVDMTSEQLGVDQTYEVSIHGNGLDAIKAISEQPWCHMSSEGALN